MKFDLQRMLGLPAHRTCPNCNVFTKTHWDNVESDWGRPNPRPGEWELELCCVHCNFKWKEEFKVIITRPM